MMATLFRILIIVLFFPTVAIEAQTSSKSNSNEVSTKPTLDETVNWIVEKLNSSISDYQTFNSYIKDISFSYNKNAQKIVARHGNHLMSNYERPHDYVVEFPLKDIRSVGPSYNDGGLMFGVTIFSWGKSILIYEDGQIKERRNYFKLDLNLDSEKNLYERIRSAFENVISYFPREKEVF